MFVNGVDDAFTMTTVIRPAYFAGGFVMAVI